MTGEEPDVADGLRVVRDGSVLRLTLANPDARNPQGPALWARLAAAGAEAERGGVQAVVLDAEGKSFSAGLDRRMFTPEGIPGHESLPQILAKDDAGVADTIEGFQQAFAWLSDGPAVSIALVQGHAVGAGFQLALAADMVICATDARFSMREATFGLVPDLTGTSPLVRAVGYQRALEICLTTRWVDADEALRLGLAVAVVPGPDLPMAADLLLAAVTKSVPGTATALKGVLRSAVTAEPTDQRRVERLAQVRRLRALAVLMEQQ